MLQLVADGQLLPEIGATFPLEQAAEAPRQLEQRAVAAKIVLVPGS